MIRKNHWFCRKFPDSLQIFWMVRRFYTLSMFWVCLTFRPESFSPVKFAIRKVQTFWVSAVFDRLPCQLKKITAFVWGGWVRGRVLLSYCTDIRKDFVLIDNNWHVVWCSRPYELTVCSSKDPSICNQDPSTSAHITSISFIALDNNPGPFSWLRLEWNQGESL